MPDTCRHGFEHFRNFQAAPCLTNSEGLPANEGRQHVSLHIEKFAWVLECRHTCTNAQSMIPSHQDKQYQDIAEYEPCAGAETTPSGNREAKGLAQRHLVLECFGPLLSGKQRCFPHGPHNSGEGYWFAVLLTGWLPTFLGNRNGLLIPCCWLSQ